MAKEATVRSFASSALSVSLLCTLSAATAAAQPCVTGEFLVEVKASKPGQPRRLEMVGCEPGTSIVIEEKDGKFTPACNGPACSSLPKDATLPHFKYEWDKLYMVRPDGSRIELYPVVEVSEYVKRGKITPLIAPDILPVWREKKTASGQVVRDARAFHVNTPAEQIGLPGR